MVGRDDTVLVLRRGDADLNDNKPFVIKEDVTSTPAGQGEAEKKVLSPLKQDSDKMKQLNNRLNIIPGQPESPPPETQ